MIDHHVHKLGWKVGTSRGTSCGLEWDSPAMRHLAGQPEILSTVSREPNCPFVTSEETERVTCPACRESIGRMVDIDISRAPGSLPK